MKPLALIFLAASALTAYPQATQRLTADKHNEYGLVYTLPRTAVTLDVTATHTVRLAGPYHLYAKEALGTDQAIPEDESIWEISDIAVRTSGVPDPEQRYLMQLKPGATTYIGVSADGMLLSINTEPTPAPQPVAYRPQSTINHPPSAETVNPSLDYLNFVNEDFLSSQSSLAQARLLREALMEIRESRLALSRGTAETMPVDGRQLELMLQQLQQQEDAIARAFTGYEYTETVTRSYTFTPDDEGAITLFRFSDFAGFVPADDLSGWEVKADLKITAPAELPRDDKGIEKKLPKDAVIYAIPGAASLTITCRDDILKTQTLEIAQFGTTFGLDPKLFTDKKAPSAARFDPATGALQSLTTALPQGRTARASGTLGGVP